MEITLDAKFTKSVTFHHVTEHIMYDQLAIYSLREVGDITCKELSLICKFKVNYLSPPSPILSTDM